MAGSGGGGVGGGVYVEPQDFPGPVLAHPNGHQRCSRAPPGRRSASSAKGAIPFSSAVGDLLPPGKAGEPRGTGLPAGCWERRAMSLRGRGRFVLCGGKTPARSQALARGRGQEACHPRPRHVRGRAGRGAGERRGAFERPHLRGGISGARALGWEPRAGGAAPVRGGKPAGRHSRGSPRGAHARGSEGSDGECRGKWFRRRSAAQSGSRGAWFGGRVRNVFTTERMTRGGRGETGWQPSHRGPGAGGGQPGRRHYHDPKRARGDQGPGCGVRTAARRGAAWRVAGGMRVPLTVHAFELVACRRLRTA